MWKKQIFAKLLSYLSAAYNNHRLLQILYSLPRRTLDLSHNDCHNRSHRHQYRMGCHLCSIHCQLRGTGGLSL